MVKPASSLLASALLAAALVSSPTSAAEGRYVHQGSQLRAAGSTEALSGPGSGSPSHIALALVRERASELGLSSEDLEEVEVRNVVPSSASGVTHVYLQQLRDGIPVSGAILNVNVGSDGSVRSVGNRFLPGVVSLAPEASPSIAPSIAAREGALHLGLELESDFAVLESKTDSQRHTLLSDAGIADENVAADLVWFPVAVEDLRLAWRIEMKIGKTSNWWNLYVDAHRGEVLAQHDLVIHDTFGPAPKAEKRRSAPLATQPRAGEAVTGAGDSYEVFAMPAEYPYENNDPGDPGDDVPAGDPDGGRAIVVDPADATASPFGWHDTDGAAGAEFTIPRGNNVHAYLDTNNSDSPDPGEPDGGAGLDFTGGLVALDLINDGPSAYGPAAAVNLFYWNNIIHDVFHGYGFDEMSGNFQENNYGNGGAGSDYVFAEGQDGSGVNNANFGTPADGQNPRMQMYTWNTTTPNRDGDFSSGIIIHEYGHGISNRLTGGPGNVFCLGNSEQMGEGWSDWLGMVLTAKAGDLPETVRGLGTYALGEDPATGEGIRLAPYSTDFGINNYTYDATTTGISVPHGIGFVWSTIIWEVYWDLVTEHGFNPDFYGDWTTGGNNLAIQLVLDGMKNQPCSPGFVDGRDGILQADADLTGGANECLLWKAFARRGLGESADQGSTSSNGDNAEAFDFPVSCDFLGATPTSVSICAGDDAIFDLGIGTAFAAPVTLSTISAPAGTTSSFDPNPVLAVPGTSELTLGSTGGLAAGTYDFDIHGDDTSTTFDLPVGVEVFDATPGAVALTSPADDSVEVSTTPTLQWDAAPGGGTSTVEVATDPAFSNIVESASGIVGTSYVVSTTLATATEHYWRVSTENPCGTEPFGAAYSFTTAVAPGDCPLGFVAEPFAVQDFEGAYPGWWNTAPVGTSTWALVSDKTHSGTSALHADEPAEESDQYLISPSIELPAAGSPLTMRFWNYQEIESSGTSACFDGAVVEIWTPGQSWTRLETELLTDPYDGPVSETFDSPIAGENAWCGNPQDWIQSTVDVDAWAGLTVNFRFRLATDRSVGGPGWWIDDFSVQSCLNSEMFLDGFESGDTSAW